MESSIDQIRACVINEVADALKISSESIDPDKNFSTLGIDSFVSIVITGALSDRYDVEIPPTYIYRYKSANKLAQKIFSLLPN